MTDINSLNTRTECEKKIEEAVMRDRKRIIEEVMKIMWLTRGGEDIVAVKELNAIINNNHE